MLYMLMICLLYTQLVLGGDQNLDQLYKQHVDNAGELVGIGDKLFNASQYEHALPFFTQAHTLTPDNVYAMHVWKTLWRLHRNEEALKVLEGVMHPEEALKMVYDESAVADPSTAAKSMHYCWALARTYISLNKKQKADTFLDAALHIKPVDNCNYWWSRGSIYLQLNHYESAIECYEKVLTYLKPNDMIKHASMHFNMGHAYIQLKQYEQAVSRLQQAITLNPNVAQYHDSLGTAYAKLKQPKQAKAQFKQALELFPKLTTALDDLGNYYRRKGKFEKAKEYFNAVLSIHPTYGSTYIRLGRTYIAEGNRDEALSYLHKAREYVQSDNGLEKVQKYIERAEKL